MNTTKNKKSPIASDNYNYIDKRRALTLNLLEADLLVLRRELRNKLANTAAMPADILTNGWQDRDYASENAIRELEFQHREVLHEQLRRVETALERLNAGTYGYCCDCGNEIEERRLSVSPSTLRCIGCQRALEANREILTK